MVAASRGSVMLRYAIIGAVCLLAAGALAQSQSDSPAPPSPTTDPAKPVVAMEEPLPGDFWTYERRDEITGAVESIRTHVVTEVTPTDISVSIRVAGKESAGLFVYDRSWNMKSGPGWTYRPHDGSGILSPLKLDVSWNAEGDNINTARGFIWKWSGRSKVIGQETITTQAGTFDTLKIERTAYAHLTNDPTRKSEITEQTWYSTAIDHWVKRILVTRANKHLMVNYTLELIAYGRKK
jgi:hypothetical protein